MIDPKPGQIFAQVTAVARPEAELLVEVLLKKGFNGLNLADAVRTEEEAQAMREQQAAMQTAQDTIPQVAGAMAGAAASAPQI